MINGGRSTTLKEINPEQIKVAATQFSVFIANRNHGRFLAQALKAILSQSVQPREIRIFDDASNDESQEVIADFTKAHPHIHAEFLETRKGVVANMQRFLHEVNDEFVFFAASDDMILPGLFEKSLTMLLRHPEAALCSSLCRLMDENGRDQGFFRSLVPGRQASLIRPAEVARLLMKIDGWFIGNTSVYRRRPLLEIGGFDAKLGGFADNYAARLLALRHGACFIPSALGYWRRTDTGIAAKSMMDPIQVLSIAKYAYERMMQTDAAAFPVGYADHWQRRWFYGAISKCLRSSPAELWQRIITIRAPLNRVDQLTMSLCRRFGTPGRMLFWLSIALHLRRKDFPAIITANIHAFFVRLREG